MDKNESLLNEISKKVKILTEKKQLLEIENKRLINQLKKKEEEILTNQGVILSWKEKYNTLKIANTMIGSGKNKKDTKLKINSLIRDLDHCIMQLTK